MSIAGAPMDRGKNNRDDQQATPGGGAPDDWDAEFSAIVSGISGDIQWQATSKELDEAAEEAARAAERGSVPTEFLRAPGTIWDNAVPETAEERRARRELRRAQRAEELAEFQQAQAELAAARAADTEHYVPPEPPPIPRFQRKTVAALFLIGAGLLLVIFPWVMPASLSFEMVAVLGVGMLLAGGAILLSGLRHRPDPGDDGSRV